MPMPHWCVLLSSVWMALCVCVCVLVCVSITTLQGMARSLGANATLVCVAVEAVCGCLIACVFVEAVCAFVFVVVVRWARNRCCLFEAHILPSFSFSLLNSLCVVVYHHVHRCATWQAHTDVTRLLCVWQEEWRRKPRGRT